MAAAKWMGVAPWDLARQSRQWEDWALIARAAEGSAEEQRAKRSANKG